MSQAITVRNLTIYEEPRSRTIWLAVLISALLHLSTVLIGAGLRRAALTAGEELVQVSVYDITRRPEVAKVLPKAELTGGGPGPADAVAMSYTPSGAPDGPTIDLKTALDRGPSQAKIDLNRFELDRSGSMDVVYLGGKGGSQSTDEILSQPAIALTRAPGTGSGAPGRGMPGVPQPEAQLTIEHRTLAKPTPARLPETPTQELPKVEAAVARGANFSVAGPISQREIIRKIVPRYPKWALDRRISGTVVVRIWVQPNGRVKGAPTVESSSGYPDLDQVVVDALRGWEFAPLGAGVKTEDQWGVITFKFMLS
ncbi:energy transducer TonB [candidate division WOR-3 bacterium]|nr:energy transducer TonB [candidate division WOR-3 bacterium]